MRFSRKLRGDTLFITAVLVLTRLRGFILLPLLFRTLGVEAYGRWAVVTALVGFLSGVAHGQVHSYLNRRYASTAGDERRIIVWTTLAFGLASSTIVGLTVVALAPLLADVIGIGASHAALLRVGGLLVISRILADLTGNYVRAAGRFRTYSVLEAVPTFAEIGAVAIATQVGWSLAVALAILIPIDLLIIAWCLVRIVRDDPPIRPSRASLRAMLSYSLPLVPYGLGDWLMNQADRLVISAVLGPGPAGVYSAAYAVGTLPLFVVRPLQVVLLRSLSIRWDRGERLAVAQALAFALKAYLALALPAAIGISLVGSSALKMVTATSISQWNLPLLLTISVGTALYGATVIAVHALLLLHWTRLCGVIFLGSAVLNVAGNLILVPRFGMLGSAIMTLVAYAVCYLATILASRRELRIRVELSSLLKIAAGVGAMTVVVKLMDASTLPRLIAVIAAGAATYTLTVLLLRLFDASQMKAFFGRRED